MAESKEFQNWLKKEAARKLGRVSLDEEIESIKERIKTYDFKTNQVTDHRTKERKNLQDVLEGKI